MNPQPDSTPLVRMSGISKHFRGISALTDVSVDLYAGEVVGILGHKWRRQINAGEDSGRGADCRQRRDLH